MRALLAVVTGGAIALSGCGTTPSQQVSTYFAAQQSYADALNRQVAQPPAIAVAAPPLFLWDVGWIIQGSNGLGQCGVPPARPLAVNSLPSADAEHTFTLGARVPAAITNGIVSANVDAHTNSVVRLDYTDVSGRILSQVDVNPILQDPSCQKVIAAATGTLPITLVKGQILARQKYTWLQNAGGSLGANITIVPGATAVGFSVGGGSGPSDPIVLTEASPTPHFLIVQTFVPTAPPQAAVPPGARRGGRAPNVSYAPVTTPPETIGAIQSGVIGGALPFQRLSTGEFR